MREGKFTIKIKFFLLIALDIIWTKLIFIHKLFVEEIKEELKNIKL